MSKQLKQAVAARLIADKIAALNKMDDIDTFAPIILEIMRGVDHRVWHVLDEKPELFNYMNDRFYMLRQVRNNPTYGRALFDNLTG